VRAFSRTASAFTAETDCLLEQAGLTQAFNNKGLDWLTGLTADIDTKGFSGAVANLRRDPHPPPTKNKEPPALLRRRGFLVANIDRNHTHIEGTNSNGANAQSPIF
jgi:hypothetical protein